MKKSNNKRGFTLIELLVVIAIIAILAVVVVLTLNPAELLRQSRDANRVSDFATYKSAISLYQVDVSSTFLGSSTNGGYIYTSAANSPSSSLVYECPVLSACPGWSFGYSSSTYNGTNPPITSSARGIDGTGWLPVDFNAISSGAPIGIEPIDPINNGSVATSSGGPFIYTYATNGTQFKLATKMESVKYQFGGAGDVVSTDGGNSTGTYEQGTNPNL